MKITATRVKKEVIKDIPCQFAEMEAELSEPQVKNDSFLANVPKEALAALVAKAKTVTYNKHSIIVSEGNGGNSLFIILSGRVRVFSTDDNSDKEITLLIQHPGSCFGEISMLCSDHRSASVIALEKTTCTVIAKNDFLNWLRDYPDMAISLLEALSEKITRLTDKVRQMALLNVYERTVYVLKELAIVEGNISVIHNKPSHQDLASMVGASREMVGKIMHDLAKGGYVKAESKTLVINKKLPSSW